MHIIYIKPTNKESVSFFHHQEETMNGFCFELRHPKEGHFSMVSQCTNPRFLPSAPDGGPHSCLIAFWVQQDQGGI